jgi:hypothetical protein
MLLNNKLICLTSLAAALVTFGVVTKNSIEQLGMPNHSVGKPVGMAMFLIGWVVAAYAFSLGKPNKYLFAIVSAGIAASVMMMKMYMEKKKTPPAAFPAIFALSWILLGFLSSNHLSGLYKYSGLVASALVIASMMNLLPMQRKKCVVDGPGMPMFVIAWMILIGANSAR